MKTYSRLFIASAFIICAISASGQNTEASKNYMALSWKGLATRMPDEWYGTDESKSVADSVLKYQTKAGGWPKNHNYQRGFDQEEWATIQRTGIGATIDNGATLTEMQFLTKMYTTTKDERYRQAFDKAFNYLLEAQYKNGGWPQYYPVKDSIDEVLLDKTKPYSMHITYNDDAMVNVMEFLKRIADGDSFYAPMHESTNMQQKTKKAFDKGVDCILQTQIKVNGKPTVWCAQHNEVTLAPANARAYELASFSGSESVGIVLLLMDIEHPTKQVINAVTGAVSWFEEHKIKGIKIESTTNSEGKRDRVVVTDTDAKPLWARFYDLDTGQPYFADRDGIKRSTLAEIGYERRNGYSWYTTAPQKVLDRFPGWKKQWNSSQ